VEPRYRILVSREGALDELEIQIEVESSFMADTVRRLQAFQHEVEERMRQELGVRPRVRLVEPRSVPVDELRRVIDSRGRMQ
jgi:phenylacetate-CoA ligase